MSTCLKRFCLYRRRERSLFPVVDVPPLERIVTWFFLVKFLCYKYGYTFYIKSSNYSIYVQKILFL